MKFIGFAHYLLKRIRHSLCTYLISQGEKLDAVVRELNRGFDTMLQDILVSYYCCSKGVYRMSFMFCKTAIDLVVYMCINKPIL